MMSDIECAFSGRISQGRVRRKTKSGKDWLTFSVAIDFGDNVDYVSVAFFGDTVAETAPRLR